ncbi:MAG: hypothetical protein LBG81_00525 [Coriobacteriaceae bacterium]|jgi:hypothetical protein|nr:hypothetical protein [Coriobacteriaceae bacterium]
MRFSYRKGNVTIEYNGKKARFHGDICPHGFIALVSSMEWADPDNNAPVTEEDRRELIRLINRNATPTNNKFYFVDDDYYALDYYNNL